MFAAKNISPTKTHQTKLSHSPLQPMSYLSNGPATIENENKKLEISTWQNAALSVHHTIRPDLLRCPIGWAPFENCCLSPTWPTRIYLARAADVFLLLFDHWLAHDCRSLYRRRMLPIGRLSLALSFPLLPLSVHHPLPLPHLPLWNRWKNPFSQFDDRRPVCFLPKTSSVGFSTSTMLMRFDAVRTWTLIWTSPSPFTHWSTRFLSGSSWLIERKENYFSTAEFTTHHTEVWMSGELTIV